MALRFRGHKPEEQRLNTPQPDNPTAQLARWALLAFVITFIAARTMVLLIMSRRVPNMYLFLQGTHVHHLNYGIFLLAGVGAYLLFQAPHGRAACVAALVYGIAMALTFDEFGMWLHLGGSYWQRASVDATIVVAATLALSPMRARSAPTRRVTARRHRPGDCADRLRDRAL